MSLFDIIKYPIDIRFRLEDLERIPSNILWIWAKEDLGMDPIISCPINLHSYVNNGKVWFDNIWVGNRKVWLKALQRRIIEHDG